MSLFNNVFGGDSSPLSSWNVANSGSSQYIYKVVYANNTFLAMESNVLHSADGITWTSTPPPSTSQIGLYGLAYGAGVWVGGTQGHSTGRIFTSADNGTTWVARNSSFAGDDYVRTIAYGNGIFVAYGGLDTFKLVTSTNGTTWTNRSLPASDLYYSVVTFANGRFFLNSGNTGACYTSTNGSTWALVTGAISSAREHGITYGNGKFVMLGARSHHGVATSTNGTTWVKHQTVLLDSGLVTNVEMNSITYAEGLFVAVGNSGTVLTSEDGITWTKKTSPNFGTTRFYSVCYGNGKFVITGSGGKILYSTL